MSGSEIHTSQHVGKNNQIAREIVYFHDALPASVIFKQKSELFSNNKRGRAARRFSLQAELPTQAKSEIESVTRREVLLPSVILFCGDASHFSHSNKGKPNRSESTRNRMDNEVSRRQFVISSGMAVAAACLAPSRLLSQEGLVAIALKESATAKITVQKLRRNISVLLGCRRKHRRSYGAGGEAYCRRGHRHYPAERRSGDRQHK